jgi:hypothetical protein
MYPTAVDTYPLKMHRRHDHTGFFCFLFHSFPLQEITSENVPRLQRLMQMPGATELVSNMSSQVGLSCVPLINVEFVTLMTLWDLQGSAISQGGTRAYELILFWNGSVS